MSRFDETQVMVTLAALAYVAPIPDDAVHSVADEEQYMLGELTRALAGAGLATQGEWSAVWIALSDDRGNFAYVARRAADGALAVAVRGTVFAPALAGVVDAYEDLRVGVTADFTAGGQTVQVSQGASTAFGEVTGAKFTVPGHPLSGTTLVDALKTLVAGGARTLYVTGHSLGGCVSTLLGLHLRDVLDGVAVNVYTFAAPTAGLAPFAALYDDAFGGPPRTAGSAWRVVNRWDVVPNAWATLGDLGGWYPSPGPGQDLEVEGALLGLVLLSGSNAYVQPSTNVVTLNADAEYGTPGSLWDPSSEASTVDGFKGQVLFQHSVVHAYMSLLGLPAPLTPPVPAAVALDEPASVRLVEPGFVHLLSPGPRSPSAARRAGGQGFEPR